MKERSRVDTAWISDSPETGQDENTPRPWNGTHGKPCASLRLVFADGSRQGLSYSDFKGYQLRDDMLKIYFTTATVVCVGRYLEELANLVEDEAARYIRAEHKNSFDVQIYESFIERIELQPPNPDALTRKP
jgi:hypothetical protein